MLDRARPPLLVLLVLLSLTLTSLGCAGTRAYRDWRPGLSAADFDGIFEISLDEYDRFADTGEPNTLFDRHHAIAQAEAAPAMAELGERLAGAPADPRGYAIVSLDGDGSVGLLGDRGSELAGTVDWFAVTPDRRHAALLSDTKLAVVVERASAGIDLGSLLGSAADFRFMMLVDGDELTVFALPEFGGAVTANEPGFVLSFRHLPGAREVWDITVARVSIAL